MTFSPSVMHSALKIKLLYIWLFTQILPNATPTTKSKIPTSPNAAPITKSNIARLSNTTPATKKNNKLLPNTTPATKKKIQYKYYTCHEK